MRLAVWAAALAVAMAGCSSEEGTQSTDTTRPAATTTTDTPTSGGPPSGTAALTAEPEAGDAPLSVTFTIDADGDAEAWTLVFGDESEDATGGDFPSEASHTYEEGTFTAMLHVTFADGTAASDTVAIVAEAAPVPGGPQDYHEEYEEAALFGVPGLNGDGEGLMYATCEAGGHGTWVLCYEVPVEAGAKELVVAADAADVAGGVVPDYDMEVYDPSGAHAGGSGEGGTAELFSQSSPAPGTWLAIVYYWAGGPGAAFGNVHTVIDVDY